MTRIRSVAPMLVALVVIAAGLTVVFLRKPTAIADDAGGIHVVAGTGTAASPSSGPTAAAAASESVAGAYGSQSAPAANGLPADLDPAERAAMMPRMFRKEPRDPAWAPATEKSLQHAFAGIPYLAPDPAMAVRCATSICEVSGEIDQTASIDNANIAMQQLQARMGADRLPAGLGDSTAMLGPLPDRPGSNGYRLYLRRR